MLRLAFHDCLPYGEELGPGEISGCDGCLNPTGMNMNLYQKYGGKGSKAAPDSVVLEGNNNGLTKVADLLEEVYTNPNFPNFWYVPKLTVSMKDSGKSRADLWAFAGHFVYVTGVKRNNDACNGVSAWRNDTIRKLDADCLVTWPSIPAFKTGRKDCIPSPNALRPWHAPKHENHPSSFANGPQTIEYFKKNFPTLNTREVIALTSGGHSMARAHPDVSYFRYDWTQAQTHLFNNQMLRMISNKPAYFGWYKWINDVRKFYLVGRFDGSIPPTKWVINKGAFTKSGGPAQWFFRYLRCPATNDCATMTYDEVPPQNRFEPPTPKKCCENLEPNWKCHPDCEIWRQNDETAISSDMGFYLKFKVDKATGEPYGCKGIEKPGYMPNGGHGGLITCDKEDYAPDGEPLYAIVDDMADHQSSFMSSFVPAFQKMSENGYADLDLTIAPNNWFDYVLQNM